MWQVHNYHAVEWQVGINIRETVHFFYPKGNMIGSDRMQMRDLI